MKSILLLGAALLSILIMGCAWNNKAEGGVIGAGAGGVAGGVIGRASGNTALGAIIGAAVGGTTGVLIGNAMDKRAEEMRRDIENAKIERIGEEIEDHVRLRNTVPNQFIRVAANGNVEHQESGEDT